MNISKKLALLLIVGAMLIFLAISFTPNTITSRGIVLGLGIDYLDDSYIVTAEIVSPGGGEDQQVGTFSKIIQCSGDTVPSALANMYAQTGRQISLGQCQILLLGQSLYASNKVAEILPYFTMSDEYKDSSSLCCVYGEASAIMQTQLPLSKSISFTLVELLKQSSNKVSLPNITLSRFAQSGMSLSFNSMCPLVEYVEQQQAEEGSSDIDQCIYNCYEMVLFDNFDYVGTVDKYNSVGYTLLDSRIISQVYTVDNTSTEGMTSSKSSISVTAKKVDISVNDDNSIDVGIKVSLQEMSHTDIDNGGMLHPQVSSQLDEAMLEDVKQQIYNQADSFLQLQGSCDVDIVGLFKALEVKHGVAWAESNSTLPIADIVVTLSIQVVED